MSNVLVITQSDVKSWLQCQRRYYYSRVLNLEPRKPAIQLMRGTALHEMIQAKAMGTSWKEVLAKLEQENKGLFKEEQDEFGTLPKELKRMFLAYIRHWRSRGEELEYQLVEQEMGPLKLTKHTAFMGKCDGLSAPDQNRRNWLVEHKTHKKIPDEIVRLSNMQILIYTWALRKMGYKVHGVLWDYIRTKPPTKPKVLKGGGLSKAKKIDTNYETYYKVIEENNLNPDDYRDILRDLKARGETFFKRVYLPIQESAVDEVFEEFKRVSLQIYENRERPARNLSKDCNWCPFYSLCHAELNGMDAEFIKKAEFKERQKRYSDLHSGVQED